MTQHDKMSRSQYVGEARRLALAEVTHQTPRKAAEDLISHLVEWRLDETREQAAAYVDAGDDTFDPSYLVSEFEGDVSDLLAATEEALVELFYLAKQHERLIGEINELEERTDKHIATLTSRLNAEQDKAHMLKQEVDRLKVEMNRLDEHYKPVRTLLDHTPHPHG